MAVSKDEILETVSNMSVMEVVDLISAMEEMEFVRQNVPLASMAEALLV